MKRERLPFMGWTLLSLLFITICGCSEKVSDGDDGLGDTGTSSDTLWGLDGSSGDLDQTEKIIHKSGESIIEAQKWSGVHLLEGNLYIKSSLEIAPCTRILVGSKAKISVTDSGSIKSIGTKDCPVIFTSSKDSKAKGDWGLIEIFNTASSDNVFDYTILEFGGDGNYGMLWIDMGASVRIDNTSFDNSRSYGVYFDKNANIKSFTKNRFSNIDLNPIFVYAGEVGALDKITSIDNNQNTVLVNGGEVKNAALWKDLGIPYLLRQQVTIKASVEIEPGTKFLMDSDSDISVKDNGSIKSLGTADKNILFTSSKTSKAKGDWSHIEVYASSSSDNAFVYTVFEYGGKDNYGMLWIDNGAKVAIDNSTFRQSSSYGLFLEDGAVLKSFTNNKFKNLSMNPISLNASEIVMLDKIEAVDNTSNTIMVRGGTASINGQWKNIGIPYEFKQIVYVKSKIEVEAGTTILIAANMKISVGDKGSLRLKGMQNANINIRSAKSAPAAGDWSQIDIYDSADNDNIWDYVNVMHGGGDNYGQVWIDKGVMLTLNNCKFSEGKDCDVYVENGGNVINNNSTYKLCPK
ncbi:MAG: hypothetical protein N2746_02705 [Deltaproteobacteria bacterium]|nr:hypothetical protein [Deltaproteobacteria bacterium]